MGNSKLENEVEPSNWIPSNAREPRSNDKPINAPKVNKPKKGVHCIKCGSSQITAQRRGFGLVKGVLGVVTLGALGVLVGTHGNKKVYITCLECGHNWKAGE